MIKEMKISRKNRFLLGAASVLSLAVSGQILADTAKRQIYVESQKAGSALMELAAKTNSHIVIPKGIGDSTQLPALKGEYTLRAALDEILANTNLTYEFIADDSVMIKQANTDQANTKRKKINSKNDNIEEMIITATKRETRLQDTAGAISLLDSETIEKRGLNSMGDYLSTIPGVTIQDRGAGGNSITMRGLSVSPQTERTAVGVYFGEAPVSGMKNGPFSANSDLRMVDIERVEVLKGPQGTLYGADSMGGIVRVIPRAPELDQVEASIGAQYSNTGELGGNNYQVRGILNIPLIENRLALRGVVYRFENSGYLENIAGTYSGDGTVTDDQVAKYGGVVINEDDVGRDTVDGARLSALWKPVESLTITLSHAWQKIGQIGLREVQLGLPGTFQQTRMQARSNLVDSQGSEVGSEQMSEDVNLTSLTLEYDLGWGSVHSVSSLDSRDGLHFSDYSSYLNLFPVLGSLINNGDRFTQEFRFSSQFDGPLQLLAGLYFDDYENNYFLANHYNGDPDKAATANADTGFDKWIGHEQDPYFGFYDVINSVEQKAIFGELSYEITDRLTATIGMRHYEYDQANYAEGTGYSYRSETPVEQQNDQGRYSGETYKANLSWKPAENTLIYAQWAEGFRLGRNLKPKDEEYGCDINGNGAYETMDGGEIPVINGAMEPDTTENYELGFKGTFADNRISLDISLYHIDWEGLPVDIALAKIGCGSYAAAAGKSVAEGVELESRLFLTDALLLNFSASYNDAKLADSTLGEKGDDLPGSADINFSAGLEYGFSLAGYDAFTRFDYSYVGEYGIQLNQKSSYPNAGDYSQIHLKAGVALDNLSIDLFVNNLTNANDITWVDHNSANFGILSGFRLRPRTIGMNISYTF